MIFWPRSELLVEEELVASEKSKTQKRGTGALLLSLVVRVLRHHLYLAEVEAAHLAETLEVWLVPYKQP